jgi:RNAse (barnase) inhibitor barstar
MAVFSDEPETYQRLDLSLLKNGSIHLYYRSSVLEEDVKWLRSHNYQLDSFDCSKWETEQLMHEELASRLEFPGYYGENLNALNDCLSEITIPNDGGRVLVLHRYDVFTAGLQEVAGHVLDIIDRKAWLHLLFGRRLFALVQSDNPRLEFPLIGSRPATWNPREWLKKDRGL